MFHLDYAEQCLLQVGEEDEILSNGVRVPGWVKTEENWWTQASIETDDGKNRTILKPDPAIQVAVRYTSSMYYVLNSLEAGYTTPEKSFAIFADFTRDVILGLVASLITTISMSMSSDDTETNLKLTKLKAWLQGKRMPKGFQRVAMEHFHELWTNQSQVDLPALLRQCSPAMASNMASLLYGRLLGSVPVFRGLSKPVIGALCMRCQPLYALKDQLIIQQVMRA